MGISNMSSNFVSITFTGSYQNLISFIEKKDIKFESKHISKNTAYLKLQSEETAEEIKFFGGLEINDDSKINTVSNIKEEEYTSTAENGFEIVEAQENLVEKTQNLVNDTKEKLANVVEEVKFPASSQVSNST